MPTQLGIAYSYFLTIVLEINNHGRDHLVPKT